ncbi:ADP-ribosylglycohydrolase family protein [Cellulomonas sp. NPDC089187]|uniref:ADP-ribosylglycohydrolase family protein n=1 Tax=Cellulomonas sp. NPDC089187 TaxID=3154970 RepID=UPI0034464ABE
MLALPLNRGVLNRACGVLIGQACGDALGVPYEFAAPPGPGEQPEMIGGGLGPYEPGEWSDDTQMAAVIAGVAAQGGGLRSETELDQIAQGFLDWRRRGASDIGMQTAAVLDRAAECTGPAAERLRASAWKQFAETGRAAGNGALMRTAVVGLVALNNRMHTAAAARAVAELTHADPLAGDSCVLWSEAVRVATSEGRLDLRGGLDLLPDDSAARWSDWIDQAELEQPAVDLSQNGFTVTALQATWHVPAPQDPPSTSPAESSQRFVERLARAVRLGGDTDTVAAIAGGLLGAWQGSSVVPTPMRRAIHGWPGADARRLGEWGRAIAQAGVTAEREDQPSLAPWRVQSCPLCGTRVVPYARYPDHLCAWCADEVTDEHGRPVRLYNTSFGGGYTGQYLDGSTASQAVLDGRVWIDAVEYRAQEARFGGIVVQPRQEER